MTRVAVYRCGPSGYGCGREFRRPTAEGPPRECPLCWITFCGDECCGHMWECVRTEEEPDGEGRSTNAGAKPAGEQS